MPGRTVNGSEKLLERTGARALAMLTVPLNRLIIRALSSGPKRQVELRREAAVPQRALRPQLRALAQIGAIVKRRRGLPGSLEYELAEPGRELRFLMIVLERWLAGAPDEPLSLESPAGGAAIEALVDGWSSTAIRALAAGPCRAERRLAKMGRVGLIERAPDALYAVTDWLRRGAGPIVAASRWERRNARELTARIARIDAEAAMLLAMPLLQPGPELSGSCRMVVELPDGDEGGPATVTISAKQRRIVRCAVADDGADAWASGPPDAWFRAAIEADPEHLELGGDRHLARALLNGLYSELYGQQVGLSTLGY